MAVILIILGILCLGYYLFLQLLHVDLAFIWLLGGAFLAGIGGWTIWLSYHGDQMPSMVRNIILAVVLIGAVIFLAAEGCIIKGMTGAAPDDLDYIIVLGAQVRGTRPSRALGHRIALASHYLRKNPHTIAVLSGGRGPGEDISEAECMRRYMVRRGIEPERLVVEKKSTSTKENLVFSAKLVSVKDSETGLVTQNYHIYRSLKLARKLGYLHVCGLSARSEPLFQLHFMAREAFALVKEKLMRNI